MKSWLLLLLVGIHFLSCCQKTPLILKNSKQFEQLSSAPLYQKYGNVLAVKVVVDLSDNSIHYIDGNTYQYHYEYCMDNLGFRSSLNAFNRLMYSADSSRPFLLGNLNYYADLTIYTLEIGPSDRMNAEQLKILYEKITSTSFIGDQLKIFQNSPHLQMIAQHISSPLITPDEIYKNQQFQCINAGKTQGRLVKIDHWEKEQSSIHENDILICEDIPLILPRVRGIIVTHFQTPLSHITLLAKNRNIPVMALKNVPENILQHINNPVELNVNLSSFNVQPIAKIEPNSNHVKPIRLKKSMRVKNIVDGNKLHPKLSHAVGNKAGNFGFLHLKSETLAFKTPEVAFAIPFYFYEQHIANINIDSILQRIKNHPEETSEQLHYIREKIKTLPMNKLLVDQIRTKLLHTPFTKFRFRSSTNAEDHPNFNGAGLYTSKTVDLNSPKKTIENALRKVWASLWSERAFHEREYYRIDQSSVAMGILVHRSFPNEEANGVAISTNLYRDNYNGFVVNVQFGDSSVVEPKDGIQCEQFITYSTTSKAAPAQQNNVDYITFSNLEDGKKVLTTKEIAHLTEILEQLKYSYFLKYAHYDDNKSFSQNYLNYGLDIEFKYVGKARQLYIKQIRVYRK